MTYLQPLSLIYHYKLAIWLNFRNILKKFQLSTNLSAERLKKNAMSVVSFSWGIISRYWTSSLQLCQFIQFCVLVVHHFLLIPQTSWSFVSWQNSSSSTDCVLLSYLLPRQITFPVVSVLLQLQMLNPSKGLCSFFTVASCMHMHILLTVLIS